MAKYHIPNVSPLYYSNYAIGQVANVQFAELLAKRIGINYDLRRDIYAAMPKLTLEDIVKFEHDNMANKPWLYIILGDENNLDMKSLEKIAPVKRVATEEIFTF